MTHLERGGKESSIKLRAEFSPETLEGWCISGGEMIYLSLERKSIATKNLISSKSILQNIKRNENIPKSTKKWENLSIVLPVKSYLIMVYIYIRYIDLVSWYFLEIFTSTFTEDIGLVPFFFCDGFVFVIKVIIRASQNELAIVSSLPNFWKSLLKIAINSLSVWWNSAVKLSSPFYCRDF